MFYVIALIGMLGYAFNNSLMVRHARKVDGMSMALYRNSTFVVTMLPLLFFGPIQDSINVLAHWPLLLISACAGGIFLTIEFTAYRFLPVGMVMAFIRASISIFTPLGGLLLFGETLHPAIWGVLAVIMSSSLMLGFSKMTFDHLDTRKWIGILLCALGGIPLTANSLVLASLARTTTPLAAGYFWEVSIAVGAAALLLIRWILTKQPLQLVPLKTYGNIALCAWPTVIGTGCMGLAMTMGPVGVTSAISAGAMVVSSLLAVWWYHEHLQIRQWIGIGTITAAIAALKLFV